MTWLTVTRGSAPLLVSLPHTGTEIPPPIAERLASLPLARNDTDWWIDQLYGFATSMGATVISHRDFAQRHRRQPRSVRPVALSRTGHHRPLPNHQL